MNRLFLFLTAIASLAVLQPPCQADDDVPGPSRPGAETIRELPVRQVPGVTEGAECYFSPDSKSLIFNGRRNCENNFHVFIINIDGSHLKLINDRGADACSYFRPDGKLLAFSSSRDARPGTRSLSLYLMDISSLRAGTKSPGGS
jgi:hypothetical protein